MMKELKRVREGEVTQKDHHVFHENLDALTCIVRDLSAREGQNLSGRKRYLKYILNTVDSIHELVKQSHTNQNMNPNAFMDQTFRNQQNSNRS